MATSKSTIHIYSLTDDTRNDFLFQFFYIKLTCTIISVKVIIDFYGFYRELKRDYYIDYSSIEILKNLEKN